MRNCKHCQEEINENANVCSKCGRWQNNFWFWVERFGLINLVAIIAIIISIQQCSEAKVERENAELAAEQAKESLNQIETLKNEIAIKDSLNKELIKLNFAYSYLNAKHSLMLQSIDKDRDLRDHYRNELLRAVIPDSITREKFLRPIVEK